MVDVAENMREYSRYWIMIQHQDYSDWGCQSNSSLIPTQHADTRQHMSESVLPPKEFASKHFTRSGKHAFLTFKVC